jgi:hypothetical protein
MMNASPRTFTQSLSWGQVGETAIACWLRCRGWTILPVYEKVIDTGKGPRMYTAYKSGYGELIAPDMLAMKGPQIKWVEGKRKAHFTWRWTQGVWQDGIDKRHYQHYLHVREHMKIPLWILFFHDNDQPSADDLANGSPPTSPTGLYGGEIDHLKDMVDHEDKYEARGRSYPMVYWNINVLQLNGRPLATLEEIMRLNPVSQSPIEKVFHQQKKSRPIVPTHSDNISQSLTEIEYVRSLYNPDDNTNEDACITGIEKADEEFEQRRLDDLINGDYE